MIFLLIKVIILLAITILGFPFMILGAIGSLIKNSCINGYFIMELLFDWLFEKD